jgi:hypothetical protein
MHTLTHIASDLVVIAKVLAGAAFFLGLLGSFLAALLHGRAPRVAAVARVLAAAGPDIQLVLDRLQQARETLRGRPADPGEELPAANRVVAALLDAANREAAVFLEVYRQESYEALFRVTLTGRRAADREATMAVLHDVDERWGPVWAAWRAVRAAALGAMLPGHHAADERALAFALRALDGALGPAKVERVRTLLARDREVGARAVRLRDVDAELAIIASAREIARRERVQSEPPPAPMPAERAR